MVNAFSRRFVLSGLVFSGLSTGLRAEEKFIDLKWKDLLPGDDDVATAFQGIINHDDVPLSSEQPASSGVRSDWNGMVVRLPGYIVPIDQSADGVTAFLLVPFVGACVHVPPPPANQLVFVTSSIPYPSKGLFEAVNVTGMFGVSSMRAQGAEIGYALSADRVEPFVY